MPKANSAVSNDSTWWRPVQSETAPGSRGSWRVTRYGVFTQRLLTLNFAHRRIDGGGDYPYARGGRRRRMTEGHIGRSLRPLETDGF